MKMFKEYILDSKCLTPQTMYLPQDADVVGAYFTETCLVLLAIMSPVTNLTELRTFKICTNDENIYVDTVKYIDSFNSAFGIRHVIEIIRGEQ